jgi:hypothetical protein
MDLILPRRQFLRCLVGIVAAPTVVKAEGLMKVFAPKFVSYADLCEEFGDSGAIGHYEAYTSHFFMTIKLPPPDWRYIGQIANIEVPNAP